MASGPAPHPASTVHDHGFHELRVARVVAETPDSASFVLDVPPDLQPAFAYEAGQFCTFRVWVDGEPYIRCYSMASAPSVDAKLQVTVKRVPGGMASNRMIDSLGPGDIVEVAPPSGFFRLNRREGDVVAFSGGSGITPVFSLIKETLATTSRGIRLLYANRDRDAVIFAAELDSLAETYDDRLSVVHHLDVEHGFVVADDIRPLVAGATDADFYICGPGPFMDIVERTILDHDVEPRRIHIERFTPVERPAADPGVEASTETQVTIELDGRKESAVHRAGTTILQTARSMGLSPPFSCESGSCATCMAKLVDGAASMFINNALDDDEVADGWVLTCQAVPTTPSVHVVYGFEE